MQSHFVLRDKMVRGCKQRGLTLIRKLKFQQAGMFHLRNFRQTCMIHQRSSSYLNDIDSLCKIHNA